MDARDRRGGANYGEMLVGVELPRAATVIALEPNPFVIPYLTRTLRAIRVGVELMSKAASARFGDGNASHRS